MMQVLALALASIGHTCWDIVLHWMVTKDADASILHMHWLRMCFVASLLQLFAIGRTPPNKSLYWWIKFALVGWVLPGTMYTVCVVLSGYRVAISFQPFIPLFVAMKTSDRISTRQYLCLSLSLCGTLAIWIYSPWEQHDIDLWALWFSILCIIIQVMAQQEWFLMMYQVQDDRVKAVANGSTYAVFILFFSMIIWTPQHLQAAYMSKIDVWILILAAAAVTSVCKFIGIAMFSSSMTPDGIAIFECIHPLATLVHDVVVGKDMLELEDIVAICCLACGWILYPKRIYMSPDVTYDVV